MRPSAPTALLLAALLLGPGCPDRSPPPPAPPPPGDAATPPAANRVAGPADTAPAAPIPPPPTPPADAAAPAPSPGAEPSPEALAAHHRRLPDLFADAPRRTLLVQVDLDALAPADQRARAVEALLVGRGSAAAGEDASCLVDAAASVRTASYLHRTRDDGPDEGILLFDGAGTLAALVDCARRVVPGWLPADAAEQAAGGRVVLAPEVMLAAAGAGTLAFGAAALVRTAAGGTPVEPLTESPRLARLLALAGPAPVTALAWTRSADGSSVRWGLAFRPAPPPTLTGAWEADRFGDLMAALEAPLEMAALADALLAGGLDESLRGMDGDEALVVRGLAVSLREARLTVQGNRAELSAHLPPDLPLDRLLAGLLRLLPFLEPADPADPAPPPPPGPDTPSPRSPANRT